MRALVLAVVLAALACGSRPPVPRRGVVETDLGSWKFRRFQGPLLDVEVWVEGNQAEAYSASYITAQAEQRGRIEDQDLVNVFVTRYESSAGVVRATVMLARRLAQAGGYQVEEDQIGGARLLAITGHGETWVMWPAQNHVVKVGGRGRRDVPTAMVESYVDRYPSQLPGGALEGALPPGLGEAPGGGAAKKPAYDPDHPRPDVDHYDPAKVKLPSREDDATGARGSTEAAGTTENTGAARPANATGGAAKPKKRRQSR